MGLPVRKIIVACNENNILYDFLATGSFDARDRKLMKTPAPSIDILLPSNLERFLYMCTDGDAGLIRDWFDQHRDEGHFEVPDDIKLKLRSVEARWANEQETMDTMRGVYERTGQILDPHTAVGLKAAQREDGHSRDGVPIVIAGTAHYSKFPTAVLQALDVECSSSDLGEVNAAVHSIKTTTAPHKSIKDLTNVTRIHNVNCEPNKEDIVTEIRKFLKARTQAKRS